MSVPEILKSCETRCGSTEEALRVAEQQLGRPLPADYRAILLETDGLEGFIGDDLFLSLWSASDLANFNDGYAVSEFVFGVTLLGTDGGDTGYGFRRKGNQIEYVAVPLVGMESRAISVLGKSFADMLETLAGVSPQEPGSHA